MRLYLSFYGIGNHSSELVGLVAKKDAKIAVSVNVLDFSTDLERKQARLAKEIASMEVLGRGRRARSSGRFT